MPLKVTSLKISDAEYKQRTDRLLAIIGELGCSGVVLFDADYIKPTFRDRTNVFQEFNAVQKSSLKT